MKYTFIILLAAGIVFATASLIVSNRQVARLAAQRAAWLKANADSEAELEQARNEVGRAEAPVVAPEGLSPEEGVTSIASTALTQSAQADGQINVRTQKVAQANPGPRPAKEALQDPLARVALSFVGLDPEAEQYWAAAINDPTLSAQEREDLIEDLNEEGFPDPKNLTADDLALILSRIEIIVAYAPDAMDQVNADAFMEAYKDLVDMAARLMQP